VTRKQIGAAEVTPEVILWTRTENELNQRQMAARLGCYQKSISAWETGKTPPNRFYRALIASMHNGTVERLEREALLDESKDR